MRLKEEVKPEAIGVLGGMAVDNASGKMLEATVILLNAETGELVASVESGSNKGFVLPLPAEGRYSFEVDKEGYLFKLVNFQMSGLEDQFVEVRLDKIEEGASIEILKTCSGNLPSLFKPGKEVKIILPLNLSEST